MTDEAPVRRAEDPGRQDELPPRLAGRFRLTGVLRETAGAVDHLAHDDLLDRAAVITVAPVDDARAPLLVRAAGLDHPHLVPVIDLEVDGRDAAATRAVVVTDPSGGGDLGARLEAGPLEVTDVLVCGAAVADALHHVHRAGLAHLGVGPASVLLDEEGRARLGGTGLALAAPGADADGAPAGATDVHDLGALLLAALPHRSRGAGAATPVAPRGVRRFLRRMVDDDPAARPAADEVAAVLRHAALAVSAVPDGLASASSRPARTPRGVVAAAAVATAALLAGTVAAVVSSPVEEVAADAPGAATPPPALVVPSGPPAPTQLPTAGDPVDAGTPRTADTPETTDAPAVDRPAGPRSSSGPAPAPPPAAATTGEPASGTTAPSVPVPSSTTSAAAPTSTSTSTSTSDTSTSPPPPEATPPARPEGLVGRLLTVPRDAL